MYLKSVAPVKFYKTVFCPYNIAINTLAQCIASWRKVYRG
jgi:hypothetical protein